MTTFTTSLPVRRVRVSYETNSGDFKNRFVMVRPEPGDRTENLLVKAQDAYRKTYGFRSRIVCIDLHCNS